MLIATMLKAIVSKSMPSCRWIERQLASEPARLTTSAHRRLCRRDRSQQNPHNMKADLKA